MGLSQNIEDPFLAVFGKLRGNQLSPNSEHPEIGVAECLRRLYLWPGSMAESKGQVLPIRFRPKEKPRVPSRNRKKTAKKKKQNRPEAVQEAQKKEPPFGTPSIPPRYRCCRHGMGRNESLQGIKQHLQTWFDFQTLSGAKREGLWLCLFETSQEGAPFPTLRGSRPWVD